MTAESSIEVATVVRVRIPSPLRSYTGATEVDVAVPVLAPELPPTVGGVLASIDGAYPGLRFRMIDEQGHVRPHIRLFVGNTATRDLGTPIARGEVLMIVAALSGG
ncbi:MAG TPA: MoaD/ThiS family protein [Casimicrobiaceae bacterium]|nr:MoaD/ThiS family protein [Casimicrobiaceae bacterium]